VLIIVGRAIGARRNRSRLYHPEWKHIFRPGRRPVKDPSGEASA
jgi:precorrin-4 methylase